MAQAQTHKKICNIIFQPGHFMYWVLVDVKFRTHDEPDQEKLAKPKKGNDDVYIWWCGHHQSTKDQIKNIKKLGYIKPGAVEIDECTTFYLGRMKFDNEYGSAII